MHERHVPVLSTQIDTLLKLSLGACAIDATLDGGGHAEILLQRVGSSGKVLGIEQDPDMVHFMRARQKKDALFSHLIIEKGNFRGIKDLAKRAECIPADAILFDLGVSRWHFMESKRGFSFKDIEAPLSMDLSGKDTHAAADILNGASIEELHDIFSRYGEMRGSYALARNIVDIRRKKSFHTVGDLLAVVPPRHGKMHPATKLFQALRVYVNDESKALEEGLVGAWSILANGGRCAVISYHSLEDRIVKHFFKKQSMDGKGILITKKPIVPLRNEIILNPSARSAKLRVIEKL